MASTRFRVSCVPGRLVLPTTAALLMLSGHAAAQKTYFEAHGGLSLNYDADATATSTGEFEIEYNDGLVLGVAFGGAFYENWRGEIEFTARRNSVSDTGGGAITDGDGHYMAVVMVNAFRDFHTESGWTPYVGGGLGFGTFYSNDAVVDYTTDLFAYQFGAGVGYPLGERITATLDYRLLGTTDVEFKDRVTGAVVEMEYLNSSVWLGLRFSF